MRRVALLLLLHAFVLSSWGAQIVEPALDLSSLGHVALGGQFSGISIYNDTLQTETQQSDTHDGLFLRDSNGIYTNIGQSNGVINAICALNSSNANFLFVGGNFSTMGNVSTMNIASYNLATNTFARLSTGVWGTINTLFCDDASSRVYIGGTFEMSNSTNAVIWDAINSRFETVPFGGFDGPVNTIEGSNSGLIFGGQFDSIAMESTSSTNEPQQVNLQTAYVTSENPYTLNPAFSGPNNILCPSGQDGPGSTWLLEDNQAGSWSASANFTFRPSSFRIYNTHFGGRGTREFRFIAQPTNGIMNLTYVDPSTGEQAYCDARCPLSDSTDVEFQEFKFVNVIEMYAFSLAISGWYGTGGGLRGFELFTEDIYAYAIEAYNEPSCANGSYISTSSDIGAWTPTIIGHEPGYLTASLSGLALSLDSVTFEPQLYQQGNYSVRIYTPGCLLDSSCASRGGVVLSIYAQPGVPATNVTIFQTNNYDKYDTIYQGIAMPSSSSFRPRVVLSAAPGQSDTVSVVASRVQFLELSASASINLNGLYNYNAANFTSAQVNNSTLEVVGSRLGYDAVINSVLVNGTITYVGGNFTNSDIANILQVDESTVSSLGVSGLNGAVNSMLVLGQILYVAGNFTSIINSTTSAQHIAAFNTSSASWMALGGGLNAPVDLLYESNGLIGVSGQFTRQNAFSDVPAVPVRGTSFWDPVRSLWTLDSGNLDGTIRDVTAMNSSLFLAGTIYSTYQLAAPGSVGLQSLGASQHLSSLSLPFNTNSSNENSMILTGSFYNSSTTSLTMLAGHFTSMDSSGNPINNVAFITANRSVYGLPGNAISAESTVYTSLIDGQRLLLGGAISGTSGTSTLGGLLIYDLESRALASTQAAALQGANVQVNSITTRPGVAQIVVAGNFDSAGSLTCPSICVLDRASTTWQRPAIGLSGNVSSSLWLGQNILLLAGNMTLNGSAQYLATFDFATQAFASVTKDLLPGPALSIVSDTNSTDSIYIAGQSNAGAAYLAKWDGNSTIDLSSGLSADSQIYDLQFFPLLKKSTSVNSVMDSNRNLLVLGNLNLGSNGTVSGALFDGAHYTPYLLTNSYTDGPGAIRTLFSEQLISFTSGGSHLARGVVIVIALAIALFITFLLVALGILAAIIRRRREGYRPANQYIPEKSAGAVPPQSLFGEDNFQSHKSRAPKI